MIDLKRLSRGDLRIEDRGPTVYVWSRMFHYGIRALLRRGVRRDRDFVTQEYDHERDEYWKPSLSADDFIMGDDAHPQWILDNHEVVRGTLRAIRQQLLPKLRDRIEHYSKPGDLIVEFGAGTGRNLAYLARELPDRRYLGLELTPNSVETARRTLEGYGFAVEMRVADMTKPITPEPEAAVAYSVLALEQLPGTMSRDALLQMSTVATRAVVCFEPIRELFPYSVRGFASRLRQHNADYLKGLPGHARSLGLKVVTEERTGLAQDPLNEICELVVDLS